MDRSASDPVSAPYRTLPPIPSRPRQEPPPGRPAYSVRRLRERSGARPELALLVSTYHKPWHLERVLRSILRQTVSPGRFEVVVTDDGSTDSTETVAARFAEAARFPVTLTTHRREGFELSRSRNEGALASTADYLLFLDGDCVIPRDHLRMHLKRRREGVVFTGYCARLDEESSDRIGLDAIDTGDYEKQVTAAHLRDLARRHRKARFYNLIGHPEKPVLAGNNIGIWRSDFERLNGFDENFSGWGGEDTDLGYRCRRQGLRVESISDATHTCHLWHPRDPTAPNDKRTNPNFRYIQRGFRFTRCFNGLVKRRPTDASVVVAGEPRDRAGSVRYLTACGLTVANGHGDSVPERPGPQQRSGPEVEFLFLPGRGRFSGRAECNVLVASEPVRIPRSLANAAHFVLAPPGCRVPKTSATFLPEELACVIRSWAGTETAAPAKAA